MAYLMPHLLILHIPKTGSDWMRAACQAAVAGRIVEIGAWHCDLATAKQVLANAGRPVPFIATFVRNPFGWYGSAWTYYMETGRFPRENDEPVVECREFEQFVHNCLAVEPRGYVTALFERFTGTRPGDVSFIGRQESLVEDLVTYLRLAGEDFDEAKLRNSVPRNVGGSRHDSGFPGYSRELASTVYQAERRVFERFGHECWNTDFG